MSKIILILSSCLFFGCASIVKNTRGEDGKPGTNGKQGTVEQKGEAGKKGEDGKNKSETIGVQL